MSLSQAKQPDQKRVIARLAAEFQLPAEDVAKLYERECAALAIGAQVTKFLHIFAIRHVQEMLRKRDIENQTMTPSGVAQLATERLPMPFGSTRSNAANLADKPPRP